MITHVCQSLAGYFLANEFDVAQSQADAVGEILADRIRHMPRWAGWAMTILLSVFNWSGICIGGCSFVHLPTAQKERLIGIWQKSPVFAMRAVIDFVYKMSVFIHLSL